MAGARLLPIATFASYFHHLLAGRFGTVSFVTRCHTLVTASRSCRCAVLLANLTGRRAGSLVTRLDALVSTTGEWLVARQAAAEALLNARNGLALLVLAETPFGGEDHARRTSGRRMAVVLNWMLAGMLARARSGAGRLLGAARDRRIDDLGAALAIQLLERGAIAGGTVSTMAGLVALVLAARERVVAGHRADVVDVYAALLIAFVLAARTFLYAALLAAGVVGARRQLPAFDHLVHVAAAALDCGLLVARRAIAQVALAGAVMGMGGLAAAQCLAAGAVAQRNRIEAGLALFQDDRHLAAGAGGRLFGARFAWAAFADVAAVLALVIAAAQVLSARLAAGVVLLLVRVAGAGDLAVILAAVALLVDFVLARLALPLVALLGADVQLAVEELLAIGVAFDCSLQGALHQLGGLAASTLSPDASLTRRTGSGMAEQRAGMRTAFDAAANLATRVRNVVAIQCRILDRSAEAEIVSWNFLLDVLAGRTTPAALGLRARSPFDDATQMEDVVAVVARPDRIVALDELDADEAFEATSFDFPNELLALRELLVFWVRLFRRGFLLGRHLRAVFAVLQTGFFVTEGVQAVAVAIPVVATLVAAMIVVALVSLVVSTAILAARRGAAGSSGATS